MYEFSCICLTTDFSKNAEAAVPLAAKLARQFNGKVFLVHVFDGAYLFEAFAEAGEGDFPNPAHWIDPLYPRLEKRLKELADEYSAREKTLFSPVLLKGNKVQETVKFLADQQINCLVIATHGRTGLGHLMLGSMAEHLVRLSPCPVLTVCPVRRPGP